MKATHLPLTSFVCIDDARISIEADRQLRSFISQFFSNVVGGNSGQFISLWIRYIET